MIVITLDTTRVDHLSAFGYERRTTPELEAFVAEAVRFTHTWSTAPWTLPAHASLLTGKRPCSHGANNAIPAEHETMVSTDSPAFLRQVLPTILGERHRTLAEILRDNGWQTAAFIGGPYLLPDFGLLQGYEHQDIRLPERGKRRADELTDTAVAWLESVDREQPVHLLINYFDPHGPYQPPVGFDRYSGSADTAAHDRDRHYQRHAHE